jgi:hypothetical protein
MENDKDLGTGRGLATKTLPSGRTLATGDFSTCCQIDTDQLLADIIYALCNMLYDFNDNWHRDCMIFPSNSRGNGLRDTTIGPWIP